MGFVFYDSYYPIDRRGPARARGGAQAGKDRAEWGAREKKDRAGGSSTGALCTRFTLVLIMFVGDELGWPIFYGSYDIDLWRDIGKKS
jgi:hypothetical protein